MKKIETIQNFRDLEKYENWKSSWTDRNAVDVYSYISDNVHPEDALIFCRILFPDFITVDNGIFIERNFTYENYKKMDGNA